MIVSQEKENLSSSADVFDNPQIWLFHVVALTKVKNACAGRSKRDELFTICPKFPDRRAALYWIPETNTKHVKRLNGTRISVGNVPTGKRDYLFRGCLPFTTKIRKFRLECKW